MSRDVYHQLQARWECLGTSSPTGKGNDCSISKYYQMCSTVAITGPFRNSCLVPYSLNGEQWKKSFKKPNILLHVLLSWNPWLQNTAGLGQKLQPDTGLPSLYNAASQRWASQWNCPLNLWVVLRSFAVKSLDLKFYKGLKIKNYKIFNLK